MGRFLQRAKFSGHLRVWSHPFVTAFLDPVWSFSSWLRSPYSWSEWRSWRRVHSRSCLTVVQSCQRRPLYNRKQLQKHTRSHQFTMAPTWAMCAMLLLNRGPERSHQFATAPTWAMRAMLLLNRGPCCGKTKVLKLRIPVPFERIMLPLPTLAGVWLVPHQAHMMNPHN